MKSVNLEEQFAQVADYWSPKVVGRVNDQYVKLAKDKGEFTWHTHDGEDELFLVVRGTLRIQMDAGDVVVGPGEFFVVPKGRRHNPVAEDECWVLLVEPVTTRHTGDVVTPLTKTIEQQLA